MNEILSKRTKNAKHFDNGNGSITAEIRYDQHWNNGAEWRDVVTDLQDNIPTRDVNEHRWQIKLPNKYHQQIRVKDRTTGEIFGIVPVGSNKPKGTVIGDTITYVDAYTNTDVRVMVYNSGYKVEYILKAPEHPNTFNFTVDNEPIIRPFIQTPFIEDLQNSNRPCTDEWAGVNYSFTLPDLTGLTYPIVVDPTTDFAATTAHTRRGNGTTLALARADAGPTNVGDAVTGSAHYSAPTYSVDRSYGTHDTSSIGSTSTITGLEIHAKANGMNSSGADVHIVTHDGTTGAAGYATARYGSTSAGYLPASVSLYTWYSATLDYTVLVINKTGTTNTGYRGLKDINSTNPTDVSRTFYYGTGAYATYLRITYTTPGSGLIFWENN